MAMLKLSHRVWKKFCKLMLKFLPASFNELKKKVCLQKWTDGILKCQVENGDWLKCHLAALQVSAEKPSHEHLLTEHSEKLAHLSFARFQVEADVPAGLAHSMAQARAPSRNSTSKSLPLKASSQRLTKNANEGRTMSSAMGANGSPRRSQSNVAHFRTFAVGAATTRRPLLRYVPYPYPSVGNTEQCGCCRQRWWRRIMDKAPSGPSQATPGLDGPEPGRCSMAKGSPWMGAFICGGFNAPRHVVDPKFKEVFGQNQSSSLGRIAARGRQECSPGQAGGSSSKSFGTLVEGWCRSKEIWSSYATCSIWTWLQTTRWTPWRRRSNPCWPFWRPTRPTSPKQRPSLSRYGSTSF